MRLTLIVPISLLIFACSSHNKTYLNADGCYAQYNQNGKINLFPIAKVIISGDEKQLVIRNNGTSEYLFNLTTRDKNNPSKITCVDETKALTLNQLFH